MHCLAVLVVSLTIPAQPQQPPPGMPAFQKQVLDERFFSEGATAGDLDRDGHVDVTAGPFWFRGPDFRDRRELYPPLAVDPRIYSDHFFSFVHDFDGDGWNDVLRIGFPGKQAVWYQNPRGAAGHWPAHVVFDGVDNESPTFADLTGDGRPELVCMFEDRLGYAVVDWQNPTARWTWHPLSATGLGGRFTHGLGTGDLDGDGRVDVLWKHGWWQQPAALTGDPQWQHHAVKFCEPGGAQMLVFDVDGDGLADVVTSDHAHGYGLCWHRQRRGEQGIGFERHGIVGSRPEDNEHGLVLGGMHALCSADVDRDGCLDVITGNRYWAHAGGDPVDRDRARLMWFRCVRGADRVRWVPHQIDEHSGVGTQVVAADVDADGAVDVVVGNKMGIFVHRQAPAAGDPFAGEIARRQALAGLLQQARKEPRGGALPNAADGRPLNFDFETGDLRDWTADGEAFARIVTDDAVAARRGDMQSAHTGRHWLGSYEAARSDQPVGTLTSVPFVLEPPHISFLIGGGRDPSTRMEIVRKDDGAVLFTASGHDDERMRLVGADLSAHRGANVLLRLFDAASGHWGHLNFDDFRLHAAEARTGNFAPADAIERMTVPKGFRVEAFAAEPEITQPVAMAVDERGRLWVAEAHSYPRRRPAGEGLDRIVVFTDADGDGHHDQRTVFLDRLNLVSGIQVGFGGVYVGAAPELLFVPDRDGDLVPDGPAEVLLDGWHYEDTHETLNSFTWGPDGWLYGCHGVFTHSRVGPPGCPDDQRQPLDAAVWRFHPTARTFEVFAHGTSNPWGVDFDDRGQAFITACVIPHLYHMIQGAFYHRQSGRHFHPFVYDDLSTIADHLHYQGKNAHAGNGVSDQQGGGHAHCGALLYRGGRWPVQYAGGLLMVNLHGHRLNHDLLLRAGSGFVGSHGPDFLVTHDNWFLGTALAHAHDGNVYLLDWYDDQTCHHTKIEAWDRSNGRIYKLCYGQGSQPPRDLGALADAELVPELFAANEYTARTARRLLQHRRAIAVAPSVRAALDDATAPEERRLRALWALHVLGALGAADHAALLRDRHEYVRAFTIQFVLEDRQLTDAEAASLAELAQTDASAAVRLYLAAAMQRMPNAARWPIAEALVRHAEDAGDHNLPKVIWYGIEPALVDDPQRALRLAHSSRLPRLFEFVVRRLTEAGGSPLDAVVDAIATAPDASTTAALVDAAQHALLRHASMPMPTRWAAARTAAERFPEQGLHDRLAFVGATFGDTSVLPTLERLCSDPKTPRDRRERALDLIVRLPGAGRYQFVLRQIEDGDLGERALRALANFDAPEVPAQLLAKWPALPLDLRQPAVATLCSRPTWALELLDAIARGTVQKDLLDAPLRQQLAQLESAPLQQKLAEVWGRTAVLSSEVQRQIDAWKQKLPDRVLATADLPHGRALYTRTCGACHQLYGQGFAFGPDLTGSNRRDLDYLLGNILDPGREVARDYMMAQVKLKSGGVVMGMLTDETDTAVTVKSQAFAQVVAKADIDSTTRLEVSLMPPGQLDGLSADDVRDLIGYLRSDMQVPLRAEAGNAHLLFGGSTLAYWDADPAIWSVEDGEIVGRSTTGLPRNDFARSHLLLGDFELSFEVKLVGDQGNSGVQFRSEVLADGDVKGPQADIGPGWWGKLYEEHGRGLLEATGGEQHVNKGDWNRYRIVAEGSRVRTWINDQLCLDRDDAALAKRGILALQLHSGGPTEVRFREFELQVK